MLRLRFLPAMLLTLALFLGLSRGVARAQTTDASTTGSPNVMLEPEDVILQQQVDDVLNGFAPPTPRITQEIVRQQDQRAMAAHPSILQEPNPNAPVPVPAILQTSSVSSAATATDASSASSLPTFDAQELRILARIEAARARGDLIDGNNATLHANQNTPLAGSGMASDAMVAVVIAAAGWTLWRARKAERASMTIFRSL